MRITPFAPMRRKFQKLVRAALTEEFRNVHQMGAQLEARLGDIRKQLQVVSLGQVVPLPHALRDVDAIITCNEINDRHGTGVILGRVFGQSPGILSIRAVRTYGEHKLGEAGIVLPHTGLSRAESFVRMYYVLAGSTVRRVLCVPHMPSDLISAIVLKEMFHVPLCIYIMDDQNLYAQGIPDDLMAEALAKSDLRLAISPEMRDAYENKYGSRFWVVPPLVAPNALRTTPELPPDSVLQSCVGALVGNLWSERWLGWLRQTVRDSGLQVHWYGNAGTPWLSVSKEELARDGIVDCGFLPETELTERLKHYAYALVPAGTLDEHDDRQEIARLSLPTRLAYLLAVAGLPVIVLGSAATCAARFVQRFRVGSTADYSGPAFRQAVAEICARERQNELRSNAAASSRLFSAEGMADWLWQSLERGEPVEDKFGRAMPRSRDQIIGYIDPPAPKDLWRHLAPVYQALRRLKQAGFAPDFVIDIGSSNGSWSDTAKRLFPAARYLLVDPLHSRYAVQDPTFFERHPDFECLSVALSDRTGEQVFQVSEDLFGSSLFQPRDFRKYEPARVPVVTLDSLFREKQLSGRGLLKIDAQFAEHLILAGAKATLAQVDALLMELSLVHYVPHAKLFGEMCELVASHGFRYFDDAGEWRCPVDGMLLQKDVLFVRQGLFVYQNR